MTALDAYDRLEAVGILKRSNDDAGTEVVVTFGEATLTMNALGKDGDTPITHWSLAAVDLISEHEGLAIYSLNAMTEETLEIADKTLRGALAKVLQDRKSRVTHKRTSRTPLILGGLGIALIAGYFLLPALVEGIAKDMISPERAEVLADEMMPMIEKRTGPACTTPLAAVALERLAERLNPGGETVFAVHDLGEADVISLAGGRVLLGQTALEQAGSNEEIAGLAAIGIAGVIESPAITELFRDQGLFDGFKFMTSGKLPQAAKERAVNRMMTRTDGVSETVGENAALILSNAGMSLSGLARFTGQDGDDAARSGEPVMTDQEWAALKAVCDG